MQEVCDKNRVEFTNHAIKLVFGDSLGSTRLSRTKLKQVYVVCEINCTAKIHTLQVCSAIIYISQF